MEVDFIKTNSFNLQRRELQIKIVRTVLIMTFATTIITFFTEISYYKKIWDKSYILTYIALIILFALFVLVLLFFVQKECKRLDEGIREKRVVAYLYSTITLVTLGSFVFTFIGIYYGDELVLLAIPLSAFSILLLLNNSERFTYSITANISFILFSFIVYLDNPFYYSIVIKSSILIWLNFLIGKLSFEWYTNVCKSSYLLEENKKELSKNISILSAQMNLPEKKSEVESSLQLNLAVSKLFKEVSISNSNLEKALKSANEASKAKEDFLATMSHEIRTPLNAIVGSIRELSNTNLDQNQRNFVYYSEASTSHLMALINNILDFSKIEAGKLNLVNESINISTIIKEGIDLFIATNNNEKVKFNFISDKDICKYHSGDSIRLKQILLNLLSNSVKFTNEGLITVKTVVHKTTSFWQEFSLIVEDTGLGISKDFKDNIFNKFAQERNNLGGTGLGLSIVYELVKLMNGKIDIESKINEGTKISIKLKLNKGSKGAIDFEEERGLLYPKFKSKRVLVAEDNELNKIILRKTLDRIGVSFKEVNSGKEAIQEMMLNEYDLVLMDIRMPNMSGDLATIEIREKLKLKVPIIALTANAFQKDIDYYRSIGMDDCITKPFDEKILMNKMIKQFKKTVINFDVLLESCSGDLEFMEKIKGVFLKDLKDYNSMVPEFILKNDFVSIGKLTHKIKPNLAYFGLTDLKNEILDVENGTQLENEKLKIIMDTFNRAIIEIENS